MTREEIFQNKKFLTLQEYMDKVTKQQRDIFQELNRLFPLRDGRTWGLDQNGKLRIYTQEDST